MVLIGSVKCIKYHVGDQKKINWLVVSNVPHFHSEPWGRLSPNLTFIFFQMGLVQPPISYRQVATPEGTMGATDSLNVAMLEAWAASSANRVDRYIRIEGTMQYS